MIEHIERYPRVRDRAIFGDPDDIVDETFDRDCHLSARTQQHQVLRLHHRRRSRGVCGPCRTATSGSAIATTKDMHRHGRRIGGRQCATARRYRIGRCGSQGVTGNALRGRHRPAHRSGKLAARFRRRGHGYITDLHLRLAACDIAVVQGGLTTCMELTAAGVRRNRQSRASPEFRRAQLRRGLPWAYAARTSADSRAARLLLDLLWQSSYAFSATCNSAGL